MLGVTERSCGARGCCVLVHVGVAQGLVHEAGSSEGSAKVCCKVRADAEACKAACVHVLPAMRAQLTGHACSVHLMMLDKCSACPWWWANACGAAAHGLGKHLLHRLLCCEHADLQLHVGADDVRMQASVSLLVYDCLIGPQGLQ
jgi:hypothetical protein